MTEYEQYCHETTSVKRFGMTFPQLHEFVIALHNNANGWPTLPQLRELIDS
jgi:hypothetical protein